jgi:hypothetical protein
MSVRILLGESAQVKSARVKQGSRSTNLEQIPIGMRLERRSPDRLQLYRVKRGD